HPCRLEVDHELELCRLPNWEVGDFITLKDAASIDAALAESVAQAVAIAHQAPSIGEIAPRVHRWYCVACGQFNKLKTMPVKQGIGGHQQCPRALLNERCKRHVKVSNASGLQKEQLLPRWERCRLQVPQMVCGIWIVGI